MTYGTNLMEYEDGEEYGQDGRSRVMELSNINENVTKLKSALNFLIRKSEIFPNGWQWWKTLTKIKFIYPFLIFILLN